MTSKLSVALVQLSVGALKKENLNRAAEKVKEAAQKGAKLISLPECFNSPYGTKYFPEYAEEIPGESTDALSAIAKENSVYLIGGSIPERDGNNLYNTCTVWGPSGDLLAKHRKVHLFDIDVPGGITFKESDCLSPGDEFTTFDIQGCKVGVGICYDIRFSEMAQIYAKMGCKFIVYPGAFNMTTGPVHWEQLVRGRALDNQLYAASVSPARDCSASYVAWGHSTLVDPWGKIVGKAEEGEDIIYADIDLNYVDEVRKMVPLGSQRRHDLYDVVKK